MLSSLLMAHFKLRVLIPGREQSAFVNNFSNQPVLLFVLVKGQINNVVASLFKQYW